MAGVNGSYRAGQLQGRRKPAQKTRSKTEKEWLKYAQTFGLTSEETGVFSYVEDRVDAIVEEEEEAESLAEEEEEEEDEQEEEEAVVEVVEEEAVDSLRDNGTAGEEAGSSSRGNSAASAEGREQPQTSQGLLHNDIDGAASHRRLHRPLGRAGSVGAAAVAAVGAGAPASAAGWPAPTGHSCRQQQQQQHRGEVLERSLSEPDSLLLDSLHSAGRQVKLWHPVQKHQQADEIVMPAAMATKCEQRMYQYVSAQRHIPSDNKPATEFWLSFVAEFFAPGALLRWCLPLPPAPSVFDGIIDPVVRISYSPPSPRAPMRYLLPHGRMVLEYACARQEASFALIRVVQWGQLRITFGINFKILGWEFCVDTCQTFDSPTKGKHKPQMGLL
eukprot:jgi/Mesen1/10816/ME000093S10333